MTLIVGVRCEDGVIVGADTIRTYFSSGGTPTIEQEIDSKIDIYNENVIFATAGSVGTSQMVKSRIKQMWADIEKAEDPSDAREGISELIWQQLRPGYRRAGEAKNLLHDNKIAPAACVALLATPLANEPALLQYDYLANSTDFTLNFPIVSLGSGQQYADPFLAFIKRAIWKDSAPRRVADGITGVLWTLQHVNQVNAGAGVGGKPTIAVLHKPGADWIAEVLTHDRIDTHRQLIQDAESALIDYLRSDNTGAEAVSIPLPGSPAADGHSTSSHPR